MESRTTSSPESRRPPIVGESLVVVVGGVVVGGGDAVPAAPAVPAVVLLDVSLSSYVFFSAFSRSFLGGKSVESVNNTHPSDPSLFLFSLKISSKRGSTNKDSIGSSASSVSPLSPMLFLMRSGDARPFSSKKDFLASSTSAFTVAFVAFVVGVAAVADAAAPCSLSSLFLPSLAASSMSPAAISSSMSFENTFTLNAVDSSTAPGIGHTGAQFIGFIIELIVSFFSFEFARGRYGTSDPLTPQQNSFVPNEIHSSL